MRLDERTVKVARYLLDRHSAKVVFYGRFVLRTYAAFLAGQRAGLSVSAR